MKKLLSLTFAGMVGGLVTFGGIQLMEQGQNPSADKWADEQLAMNVSTPFGHSPSAPFDFKTAAQKAMPAVVHITAMESEEASAKKRRGSGNPFFDFFGGGGGYGPQQGTGSGVIFSEDGYIITNNHVIDFADDVEVTLYDNRTFQAKVVGTDKTTDLAVLKIEGTGFPTLEIADSDNAEVGEWVLAVGNPFDLTSTVTVGIISAKARDINILSGRKSIESFIQTDAAVNPGNSGGALVDSNGRLLGINAAIATQTGSFSGYSFAIPINIATKVVEDLIEHGEVKRGLIGIDIQDLDSEQAEELGLDISQGVVIVGVMDGAAGQFAGLLPDDVITKVDGRPVKSAPELQELVGRKRPGDTVTLTINRNGQQKKIPVRLKAG
jgi:Do/DeqQ family serine protease